ncbi:Hypothetical protein R9X50_00067300 [Acrodontium crateriforme]|uniref:NAD(P)-binding protein n=1 Tax=Acrodontium crateriforme TaxID=150365 RepID=A0AAQ3LYJ3_9PEZI|nr:Hypothetical protein R9X50_00067300 [Acrodontium crateriforme]
MWVKLESRFDHFYIRTIDEKPFINIDKTMPTILISGAANGLGQAFLAAYQNRPEVNIIAIDRSPITTSHPNVTSFAVDVSCEKSINDLAQKIKDVPIELAIHSAGIRGLVPTLEVEHPENVAACETLEGMTFATLTTAFQVNAAGTFMLLRALLPNLKAAGDKAKVIVMSSRMGSVGNNERGKRAAGAAYAYRASKAAMNTMVRSFAVDVPEVTFVLCHPGRVETKLVKGKEEGAISADESVADMLPLIEKWSQVDSGKYYDRFGEVIEW